MLIYTNDQRNQDNIASAHDGKDKQRILDIAHQAYHHFLKEDIKTIGNMLYEGWIEKRQLSPLISNQKIDGMMDIIMKNGAYGAKLMGTGGCGFIMVICNPKVKQILTDIFKTDVLPFKFETHGVSRIY